MVTAVILFGIVLSVLIAWAIMGPLADKEPPTLPDFYWGPKVNEGKSEDKSIRPFKINVTDKVLKDLKTRLEIEVASDGNRLTPPLEGIGFQYGFNSKALPAITSYWLNKFDWRAREKELNKFPQFMTTIAGLEIHFQHVKSVSTKVYKKTRPLLLLHGWPGSFIEFLKVIPLLTDPEGDINFELVIPSLPGFGFSEGAHRPGLSVVEMAQIFQKLMARLGYSRYYVQGGDLGSMVATNIATLYPEHVIGLHVNLCWSSHPRTILRTLLGSLWPSLIMIPEDIPRQYPLAKRFSFLVQETGYFHIQSSKPDTIGIALSNSPSGLAAYMLEKFSTGTDVSYREREDGGLLDRWTLDDLLDSVMIYWVTNTMTTAMRLYAERFSSAKQQTYKGLESVPVQVPTGCLTVPHEVLNSQNEYLLQDKYPKIVSFTRGAAGGHFAAFEVPEIFGQDVLNFVQIVESKSPKQ